MISGVPMLIYMFFMPQFEYSFGGISERISFINEEKKQNTPMSHTQNISSAAAMEKSYSSIQIQLYIYISRLHGNEHRQANDIHTLLYSHSLFNSETTTTQNYTKNTKF